MKNYYRLIQGDCLEVLRTLENESIDVIITDPPYNVGKDYGNNSDKQTKEEYDVFLRLFLIQSKRVLKQDGLLLCFLSIATLNDCYQIFDSYLIYRWTLCHYAPNKRSCSFIGYNLWQPILLYSKDPNTKIFSYKQDFYKAVTGQEWFNHPTPKPIKLIEKLVEHFSGERDVILDPFIGSGTTMVACQNLRRNCIGIEINPKYCEEVKRRCFGRTFLDHEVEYQFTDYSHNR